MKKKIDSLSGAKATPSPLDKPEKPAEATPAAAPVEAAKPAEPEAKPAETEAKPAEEAKAPEAPAEPAKEEKKAEETPAPAADVKPAEPAAPAAEGTPPAEGTPADPAAPAGPPDSFDSLFSNPTTPIGKPPTWMWWLILLVFSLILGGVGFALLQRNFSSWLSATPTPSPTATPAVTETPTATPSESPSPTPTPSPTATPLDKKAITLRVLNGTATTGAAGKAKTVLAAAGFTVRTTGNASTTSYATTIVYYQKGKEAEAAAVKDALTGYSVTIEESTQAAPDMVLVIIGKK